MLHPAYTIDPPAPEDPDAADRLYELHRDAGGRAGGENGAVARPSPERRGAGRGGGLSGSSSPAAPSSVLPERFATLADRRYLARVARVIPPRTRPFNWRTEGM